MTTNFAFNAHEIDSLPSPEVLQQELAATSHELAFVKNSRQQIANILDGKDQRLLLIVGPCSIHDPVAAQEYAANLQALSQEYSDIFFIVMRTHFEKPRTITGWKGLVYDPHLNGTNDMETGLRHARKLLLTLARMNIAAATEFLDPMTPHYFGDLISWACIGARTVESQIHRQIASGLAMPVAMKNGTSGNIDVAINGILTAQYPHSFFGINNKGHISTIRTKGNPHVHIALRGGESAPNYDSISINNALLQLKKAGLPPRLVIDCSHDNSCRNHEEQTTVFKNVIEQILQGNASIKGLVLESHLYGGNQHLTSDNTLLKYAVSLTDPCLDWQSTKQLISWAADKLSVKC